jgi:hypothetical protein
METPRWFLGRVCVNRHKPMRMSCRCHFRYWYFLWILLTFSHVISQNMTSSSHKLWRHHLTNYDVIISQVMTSSFHKLWRHHFTSYDVIISQVMTSLSRQFSDLVFAFPSITCLWFNPVIHSLQALECQLYDVPKVKTQLWLGIVLNFDFSAIEVYLSSSLEIELQNSIWDYSHFRMVGVMIW